MSKAAKPVAIVIPPLALALIVYIFLFSPIFKIKSVTLSTQNSCLNSQSILKEISGQNMVLFQTGQEKKKLLEKYHCAQDLTVEKKYPSTLVINLSSEKPVAKIDGTPFSVFSNGVVTQTQDTNLPSVFLPNGVSVNSKDKITDAMAIFEINLASQLSRSDFSVSSIRIIENQTVAAYNFQDAVALFSPNKSLALQVDSLQHVLAKAKIDATKIQKIDLRYDNPTIVFKEKSQ